jgi:hypothetical protein
MNSPELAKPYSLYNDATTWSINKYTGLVNLKNNHINNYLIKEHESISPGITFHHDILTDKVSSSAVESSFDTVWSENSLSFEGGFRHPAPIFPPSKQSNSFNCPHDLNNSSNKAFALQNTELIEALLGATDSPAFPIVTDPGGAKLDLHIGTSSQTTPTGINSLRNSQVENNVNKLTYFTNQFKAEVDNLHNNPTAIRRRNDLIVNILNTVSETIVSGDITGSTLNSLKSIKNIQAQFESFKLVKSQEYVRLMVRRPAHEFSGLQLGEHMLFDHPSRGYVAAFEEFLGHDTVTVSPSYSNQANLNGLFQIGGTPPKPPNNNGGSTGNELVLGNVGNAPVSPQPPRHQSTNKSFNQAGFPLPISLPTSFSALFPTSLNIIDSSFGLKRANLTQSRLNNMSRNRANLDQFSTKVLHIQPDEVKKIVIGAKITPTHIFRHPHNSIRSLLPSLSDLFNLSGDKMDRNDI